MGKFPLWGWWCHELCITCERYLLCLMVQFTKNIALMMCKHVLKCNLPLIWLCLQLSMWQSYKCCLCAKSAVGGLCVILDVNKYSKNCWTFLNLYLGIIPDSDVKLKSDILLQNIMLLSMPGMAKPSPGYSHCCHDHCKVWARQP